MACFWILCNFFTIWQLLYLNFSWLAHILFTICPWLIHDLFMSCWWHVHNLFIICSCIVHNLFMTYSLLVICSWLFIQIFCNFINSLELPHLHYFISFTSLNSNASLEMLYFIYLTWTTHFIQNTSFELLQVGAELATAQPRHVFPFSLNVSCRRVFLIIRLISLSRILHPRTKLLQ